jgi:very-short-patch-repair endonuclease
MRDKNPVRERSLVEMAARQHGRVSRQQLLALGFERGAIHHRVVTGRLHPEHAGVYAVGNRTVTRESREMAAVLACGPGAVISHWTAAARWGFLRPSRGPVHVTVEGDRRNQRGIRVHAIKRSHPHDRSRRDGIPITSVPRTLLDLAVVAPQPALERAVNEADRQERLNRKAVYQLLERNKGRRGTKRLRDVIDAVDPGTRRTRSDLEVDFRKLCRKFKIEAPISNGTVAGFEVDIHWPDTNLIVELDHYDYHRTPAEFTRDRRKWGALQKLGYNVLPISDEWLNSDPREVAETVKALLVQSGKTGGSIASSL